MIGTRGVPARYGGFETAVEEVGARLSGKGHEVVVYSRQAGVSNYRGMRVVGRPALRLKSAETLSNAALSTVHRGLRGTNVCFLFNAANAPLLPVLKARGIPTAVHVDGLEWKRSKWGPIGRKYYLASERFAVSHAASLIADARGIQDYYWQAYGAKAVYIPYGTPEVDRLALERIAELGLSRRRYHLVVARLEPENNVHAILDGFIHSHARLDLVVVGTAPYGGRYLKDLSERAKSDRRIRLVGAIWDQELLDALYAGAFVYWHGHSVGGTNPSLLRAMGAGVPIAALDVRFNREVLGPTGSYWGSPIEVAEIAEKTELCASEDLITQGKHHLYRARHLYDWDRVAAEYEALAYRLLLAGQDRRHWLAPTNRTEDARPL